MENLYRYDGKDPMVVGIGLGEPGSRLFIHGKYYWLDDDDPVLRNPKYREVLKFTLIDLTEYDGGKTVAENAACLREWMRTVGSELPWCDEFRAIKRCLPQLIDAAVCANFPGEMPDPEKLHGLTRHDVRQLLNLLSARIAPDRDSDAFVPVGKLWPEHFDTYRKAQGFLKEHPEIRTRKPSSNRLEVHAADWIKHWTRQEGEPTDTQIEEYLAGIEQRKAEVRRGR